MPENKRALGTDLAKLDATTEEEIAQHMLEDDTPEWTDEEFDNAEVWNGDRYIGLVKEVRRGGRPKGSGTKELITLRIDRDVLDGFPAGGPGWQTRLNDTLRGAVSTRHAGIEASEARTTAEAASVV